ncbi:MAG: uL15 family ribosomal protein [Candidatus Micrarchaeota archaeon]|nr:uL15 family ribosomal protein [Candidatus Micrarchaeota archaeon]MDE1834790.1 uL15 family ribosomal protein [Candidatus Micrarchaeota archaeon]MDE1859145.1 uL15 family ribosomal protein [Candidatus Micrarchaeota archaeon]
MVLRYKNRSRRYMGTRTWGGGNKKNRRGAGSRGGVGRAGKKHKFTHIVKYEPERLHKKGFHSLAPQRLNEINLDSIAIAAQGQSELEYKGYKVLGSGELTAPVKVKASAFSKKASEKIKKAGGEAIQL